MTDKPVRARNEDIKEASRFLRGGIADGLGEVATGALAEDDTQLTKFHGIYQQDDRDLRPERRRKRLEQAYSFMARVRVPGGTVTPAQWLTLDRIAGDWGNGTLRLTTRQAFQFHGIVKTNLRRAIRAIDAALLDTLAACGDVNRNVMCSPNPHESRAHQAAHDLARRISDHLTPRTHAYHEIWIGGDRVAGGEGAAGVDEEPIYGPTYLPRKFKTVVAVPPNNDVDVFAQDLGFVAVVEDGTVVGWDVTVGGGMGMTHGEPHTYPRLADRLGFCTPEQAVDVAEKVVLVQRDHGNRADRKRARLKYTIEDRGLDWFREEVERRLGWKLGPARGIGFERTGDRYGWVKDHEGFWHFTLHVENGRLGPERRAGLREIVEAHRGEIRLTPNQNLILARVTPRRRARIDALLEKHGLANDSTGLRLNALACVALPTCALALAECERYLPDLVAEIETTIEAAGLRDDEITIRMTGCPNGCARPYLAEIGLVGRSPGVYHLYLGAAFDGSRMNRLYRADLAQAEIAGTLRPLIEAYAEERRNGERFGDFLIRSGRIEAPTGRPAEFHEVG
jgi:sulfite reductase (NADPH) hemoprotein beta-component